MVKLFVGILFGLLLVGSVAYAAIPDSGGTIHGCYLTSGNPNVRGALRVIDTEVGEACGSGETSISWEQASPSIPSQLTYHVFGVTGPIPAGEFRLAIAECPTGTAVISGGFDVSLTSHNVSVLSSRNGNGDIPTSWFVVAENEGTVDTTGDTAIAFAICASI